MYDNRQSVNGAFRVLTQRSLVILARNQRTLLLSRAFACAPLRLNGRSQPSLPLVRSSGFLVAALTPSFRWKTLAAASRQLTLSRKHQGLSRSDSIGPRRR